MHYIIYIITYELFSGYESKKVNCIFVLFYALIFKKKLMIKMYLLQNLKLNLKFTLKRWIFNFKY